MDTQPSINTEIEKALEHMKDLEVGSTEYDSALKHLKSLYDMKKSTRISPEVIIGAAVNIAGILLVLNHERLNVISSKAFMFIKRSS